jgi:uncharacterized BrkB/YihY/UPF0761 family membrane protein
LKSKYIANSPGALLATALWLLTSFGCKLYVENLSSYTAVWFYLSGFALLSARS